MSIVWRNQNGWVLSHSSFLYDLYNSVSGQQPCVKCGKYSVFHISHPFLRKNQKSSRNSEVSIDVCDSDRNDEVKKTVFQHVGFRVSNSKG